MLVEPTPKTMPTPWRRPVIPRSDIEADISAPRIDDVVPNAASLPFEGDGNAADAAFFLYCKQKSSAATVFCNPFEAQTAVFC